MNEIMLACAEFLKGSPVTFECNLTKVRYNDDGSVVVGSPSSSVCMDGDLLLELLTNEGAQV